MSYEDDYSEPGEFMNQGKLKDTHYLTVNLIL